MSQQTNENRSQIHSSDIASHQDTFLFAQNKLRTMAPDQNTEFLLSEAFSNCYQSTLERSQPLPEETTTQYRQRISWAIQAAAIETAENHGLGAHPERLAWKDQVTQQILQAQLDHPQHSLPGITVYFRQPVQGSIDQYSRNGIWVNFTDIQRQNPLPINIHLHVSSGYREQFNLSGLELLSRELEYTKILSENPLSSPHRIIGELNFLNGLASKGRQDVTLFIDRRWRLLKDLYKSVPAIKDLLQITHLQDGRHHALRFEAPNPLDQNASPSIHQMQPEEVSEPIWDFFRDIYLGRHQNDNVPSRELCMKYKTSPHIEIPVDEDSGDWDEDDWGKRGQRTRRPQTREQKYYRQRTRS